MTKTGKVWFFCETTKCFCNFFQKKFVFTAFYGVLQGKTRWERTEKLPQMSQIFTDAAAWEKPPTEYTDITEPTAENILPQIPLCTDANFRGCTCLRSALPLARARSAPTEQYWYTSYFVFVYMICIVACCGGFHLRYGWVRTLTICADLWNLWENITARKFCEFCGFCGKKSQ